MEQSCLRCHSSSETAPADLVAYYGPERSFHRFAGETISAISIRVPLSSACAQIKTLVFKLSVILAITLCMIAGLTIYLSKRWIFRPLDAIREKVKGISNSTEILGEPIDPPSSREIADLILESS